MFRRLAAFSLALSVGVGAAWGGEDGSSGRGLTTTELGRRLFERDWLADLPDGSPLAVARFGDGIGPLFNASSCAACHRQGGTGGAGPNENNVDLLALDVPIDAAPVFRQAATRRATELHPAFSRGDSLTLHRFGRDGDGGFDDYDSFRRRLRLAFPGADGPIGALTQPLGGLSFQLARRNTPALFGAGLLDSVTPRQVLQVATAQEKRFLAVAGRPAFDGSGRFGWRGQTTSLSGFVRNACANELGLRTPAGDEDQAAWPLDPPRPERTRKAARERKPVDLTERQVDGLVAYVRSLPAPRPVVPDDPVAASAAADGRLLFGEIGCAVCHVEQVGPAKHVYSDLLLHDMGRTLADRVAAPRPPRVVSVTQTSSSSSGGGYSGSSTRVAQRVGMITVPPSLNELQAATREWRTPPLWGVADSAPYLHDGRAGTLDEAVRKHDGQGWLAASRYAGLDDDGRGKVLAFLGTLRAPQ